MTGCHHQMLTNPNPNTLSRYLCMWTTSCHHLCCRIIVSYCHTLDFSSECHSVVSCCCCCCFFCFGLCFQLAKSLHSWSPLKSPVSQTTVRNHRWWDFFLLLLLFQFFVFLTIFWKMEGHRQRPDCLINTKTAVKMCRHCFFVKTCRSSGFKSEETVISKRLLHSASSQMEVIDCNSVWWECTVV